MRSTPTLPHPRAALVWLAASLIGLFAAPAAALTTVTQVADLVGKVHITEVNRADTGEYPQFVELFNSSTEDFLLRNVFISDSSPDGSDTGGDTFLLPDDVLFGSFEAIVIFVDRTVTQADIDQVVSESAFAPFGTQVFAPETIGGNPPTGLLWEGRPVPRMLQNGPETLDRTLAPRSDTMLLGFKATITNFESDPFPITGSDVIDGVGWKQSVQSPPGLVGWGPGVVDALHVIDPFNSPDSLKRQGDPGTATNSPLDTDSASDWSVGETASYTPGQSSWRVGDPRPEFAGGRITISEVKRDASGTTFPYEFVEIVNNSRIPWGLGNVFISDRNIPNGSEITFEGELSFPSGPGQPYPVLPALGAVLVFTEFNNAPTTTAIRAISPTPSNAPGGLQIFAAGNPPVGQPQYGDPAYAPFEIRVMREHWSTLANPNIYLRLNNNRDNVVLGRAETLTNGVPIDFDDTQVIDGMGYRWGPFTNPGGVAWGLGVVTNDSDDLVQTDPSTLAASFHRVQPADSNTASDWRITTGTLATPGNPSFLLDGEPLRNAAGDWMLYD